LWAVPTIVDPSAETALAPVARSRPGKPCSQVIGAGISGLPKAAGGGNGFGGGLLAAAGAVTVRSSTFTLNEAAGSIGGVNYSRKSGGQAFAQSGRGIGGGIYNATKSLALDASTFLNTAGNTSTTSDPDIYGRYSKI